VCNVGRMRDKRNAYKVFVAKPKGTRPVGRSTRKCEDNTRTDVRKIGCEILA